MTTPIQDCYDLIVIGGGSGGFAAALAGARLGLRTLLIEKETMLGGTSTLAGVCAWEPSVGGTGIPFDLYRRLAKHPSSVGIYSKGRHFSDDRPFCWPHDLSRVSFPGGEQVIDPARTYADTLRRHPPSGTDADQAFKKEHWHGVVFEPEVMAEVMLAMLNETGNCTVRLNTTFASVEHREGQIRRALLDSGESVEAACWVDSTGDGTFSHLCGAERLLGQDPRSRFNEPSAPEEGNETALNGATLLFRVTPSEKEVFAMSVPPPCGWSDHYPAVACNHLPGGDLQINMLPTMQGHEATGLDVAAIYRECEKRVHAQWAFMQYYWHEFRNYRFVACAPRLGLRETWRTVCEHMLTEDDIITGISRQQEPDIIGLTDHPFDAHGRGPGCRELAEPYGIPYRSLIVKGFKNLLVASRGAGFSSLAASSCRLSRTMMMLGQTAGTAAWVATESNSGLADVPHNTLREALRAQHVQLEWPMPEDLKEHVTMGPPN